MSSGRGGGGSAKNISGGGGGGSDPVGAGVARLETKIDELKSKIEADSKEIDGKIGNVRIELGTITGKLEQINRIWTVIGLCVVLGAGTIGNLYFSTNNLLKEIHRLEIAIVSSKPQVPPPNSR
ncbi:MAG: hypothetical protein ACK5ZB_00840 [bacterium]|jgi:hypothetical protein